MENRRKRGSSSWARTLGETLRAAYQHDCTDAAAAMAFDFVFAIFPGILVLTALLGLLDISPEDFERLLEDLGIVVTPTLLKVIRDNIKHLWDSSHNLFVIGILGVVWPASASMSTTMTALNRAYGAVEQRSFWRRRVLSIVLVASLGLALVFLFNLIVFSEQVENWLRAHWALSSHFPSLATLLRRVAGMVGALAVAASIYRLVPAVRQSWLRVLPGSLLFLVLWSCIAWGFRHLVRNFGYYNAIYGVLGTVILILLAAYLVAFTLLLGGELNAVLYHRRKRSQSEVARAAGGEGS